MDPQRDELNKTKENINFDIKANLKRNLLS
jgi:hypothetical protein